MKKLLISAAAIVLAWLCVRLAYLIPGATTDGGLSDDFWLNGFFMVLGFLVTTAAISPVVGFYLERREARSWSAARRELTSRMATSLAIVVGKYRDFLEAIRDGDPHRISDFYIADVRSGLTDFFETYESEQAAFTPEMHSAASQLRRQLLPFRRGWESTFGIIARARSGRAYLGADTIDKLRALIDLPNLPAGSPVTQDPYFAMTGEIFLDYRIDLQIGAGIVPIQHFVPLDLPTLQHIWHTYVESLAFRADSSLADALAVELKADPDTQARLHAAYVRERVKEGYLADIVITPSLVTRKP